MSVFKCKMCGGTLVVDENQTVGVCEYCGTKQTLPKLDDDRRVNLYDRANHFRRNNDFDKAAGIYEQILNDDGTDAEAYWSLVLCQYGIEYVEDPETHKRVPTVNRAQFTSVFDDDNYKSALRYADSYQKLIYEEEAHTINEIQKGILAISQKEEPFDIFICYKEADENGRRTRDSVLANDLYHELTNEGFKVFYARITLEDKLGTAYEPYIFAALNSAKVMIVLGTKPEYFKAVWVKNEWSRYLALVQKSGGKKTLIPAYRDMDPYDLPEEFSHLQAQDMSKLGFMQDLIRGIKKITAIPNQTATLKDAVPTSSGSADTTPLLKRIFIYLEDGEWEKADEYCERVLDSDPENAYAYLGKLMSELRCNRHENLHDCKKPFNNLNNYQKIMRFGDDVLKAELTEDINYINTRNENAKLEEIYNDTKSKMQDATSQAEYIAAAETFDGIKGFKDADARAIECRREAEVARKNTIYSSAANSQATDTVVALEQAINAFSTIPDWKDADVRIGACKKRIDELNTEAEKQRLQAEKRKRAVLLATTIAAVAIITVTAMKTAIIPYFNTVTTYKEAQTMLASGQYEEAYNKFVLIKGYKDVDNLLSSNRDLIRVGKYAVGNTVKFADIEWIVLAQDGDSVLLITKDCVENAAYDTTLDPVTWETCTLRTYLNMGWYNKTFDYDEQALIKTTSVINSDNTEYKTDGGNDTQDKVFLLSIDETKEYLQFLTESNAISNGLITGWWLRSPGCTNRYAANFENNSGFYVNSQSGIRPAIWINI